MYRSNGRYPCILAGENDDPDFLPPLEERLSAKFMRSERF